MQKGNKCSIKQNKVEYHWEILLSDYLMWANECFDPEKPDTYYLKV